MEKLQITGTVRRHVRHGGNIVLQTEFPVITGDSAAAAHARNMLSALWEFAEQVLATKAGNALIAAARARRIFSFTPYKITVTLIKEAHKQDTLLTLTLKITADKEVSTVRHFLFTADESLRKGRAQTGRHRAKTRKNA